MGFPRAALLAGVAGPAAFVGAWVCAGLVAEGYSPVSDTISRLAEQGTSTRPLMTAGLVGFGLLMPIYARELGARLNAPGVRAAVTTSGLATLVVALFPVTAGGGTTGDALHYAAAGLAYTANIVAPALAARALPTRRARVTSGAVAAAVATALVASTAVDDLTGLLQRTGLSLFDAWAAGLALWLLTRRAADRPAPPLPAGG